MASDEMSFETVDGRTTTTDDYGRRMPACTICSSMNLRLRRAKNYLSAKTDYQFKLFSPNDITVCTYTDIGQT